MVRKAKKASKLANLKRGKGGAKIKVQFEDPRKHIIDAISFEGTIRSYLSVAGSSLASGHVDLLNRVAKHAGDRVLQLCTLYADAEGLLTVPDATADATSLDGTTKHPVVPAA